MTDKKAAGGAMRVDTDLVRRLALMLDENNLTEIEVEDGDRRIAVKRQPGTPANPAPAAPVPPPPAPAAAPAPAAVSEDVAAANHPGAVKSPMVGTVYLSAEPGSPPFAAPGAKVGAGDTLLIIEAMKVMNPIRAPRSGRVARVLVSNGDPVEYGELLLIIE